MDIETVTPILGGAAVAREVDEIDVIRAPSIRGHLRFWWRALQRDGFETPSDLYRTEAALWGRAADEKGGRSVVEITVEVLRQSRFDRDDVNQNDTDGYALWPARKGEQDAAPAPRRLPGVRFRLRAAAPEPVLPDIRAAVRAWILFGGYGSRTRRGVGSLTVIGNHRTKAEWLPSVEEPEELGPAELRSEFCDSLQHLFGRNLFESGPSGLSCPSLSGATLLIGESVRVNEIQRAWAEALHWLRDFRQQPGFAREPGRPRPGRSRWPEADKLRHLSRSSDHEPRYDEKPAWPRAAFGLPIVGRFVGSDAPPPFELIWQDTAGIDHDRLGSPLIVKAIPAVQGAWPCALWLTRSDPEGQVIVRGKPGSAAPFGFVGSTADQATHRQLKGPISAYADVRRAFIDWVARKAGVVQVAP